MLKRLKLWWLRWRLESLDADIVIGTEQLHALQASADGLEAFLLVQRRERQKMYQRIIEFDHVPAPKARTYDEMAADVYNRAFNKREP